MRYDNKVVFVQELQGGYNPDTGNYDESGDRLSKPYFAKITDASREYVNLMYGGLRKGIHIVRVKGTVNFVGSHMTIVRGKFKSAKKYKIVDFRKIRGDSVYYVEEMVS